MLFSEMIQEVKNIVQDSSFDASIPGYVNEAFLQASGKVNIPDLKRVGVAATVPGQMFTSLAGLQDGFSGRLSKVLNNDISRFKDIEGMLGAVLDSNRVITEEGDVEYVTLEGRTLWYFPTPATETNIPVIVHANPVILEEDDDSPDAFPEICHRNIGVHGAAAMCYAIIEDAVDGPKLNTTFNWNMYQVGITQLTEWIGRHRIHQIDSVMNDDVVYTSDWSTTLGAR